MPEENQVNAQGERICGSKTRVGGICQNKVIMANGRCRMHGGGSPRGVEASRFRTGRYSQDMPTSMLPNFEKALQDTELLSTREDVALLQGMILDRLAEIQRTQANPDLEQVVGKAEEIARDWRMWDWTRMQREMDTLVEAITTRRNEQSALREVRDLLKEKAALMRQEQQRLVELQQTMTVEQVILLAQGLVGIVRQQLADVPDGNKKLRVIAAEFREIMSIREPEQQTG